jgi:CRP/FNR family transcriptional regulator, cyclic AMP receptor protein
MVPVATLKHLQFLQGLPEEQLKPLGSVAMLMEVPAGEILCRQGEPSPNIFVVVEGTVGLDLWVPGRGTTQIQTLGAGELIGWSPVLSPSAMTVTARALELCRLVSINAMQALAVCTRNSQLGMEFMRRTALTLSRRLNATRLQLLDVFAPVVSE